MIAKSVTQQVVVLGGGINALGIIRSFQKIKISVNVLSWYRDYGMSSRFCKGFLCPNPINEEAFINFLLDFGNNFSEKPMLFPTSDLFLLPVLKNKGKLSKKYICPFSGWEIVNNLLKKENLYSFAERINVSCPKTKVLDSSDSLTLLCDEFIFPIIVKPSLNINFSVKLGEKAFLIKNPVEFTGFEKRLKASGLKNQKLVFQEFIPGTVEDLFTITSYADQNSNILGYSIGHKIRQYPPDTGTIISGRIKHEEEVLNQARAFLKAAKFHGISNIEFKRDKRDGSFKLMEINPRTGVWNLSALKSGVNLPLLAYNDLTGNAIKKQCNHNADLVWLISPLDFYYSMYGFRKEGYPEYGISFIEWVSSLKGKKIDATFQWNDPLPFLKGLLMKYR